MSSDLTGDVLRAYAETPDPRARELLTSLIRHLHAFARETRLTTQEWMAGLQLLTAVGQRCDAEAQEFLLLARVLRPSSLGETPGSPDGASRAPVAGPFY